MEPKKVYAKIGWNGYRDWITDVPLIKEEHLSFEEARKHMHTVGIAGKTEWRLWCKSQIPGKGKKPFFIPTQPNLVYKNSGWVSWSDFFNNNRIYLPFEEVREYARSLNFKAQGDWFLHIKKEKPKHIPYNPALAYAGKGWVDWSDFLKGSQKWLPFEEAREIIRGLKLKGQTEWRKYCLGQLEGKPPFPSNMPKVPHVIYADKWEGYSDWVGNNFKSTLCKTFAWPTYEETRAYATSLNFSSGAGWIEHIRSLTDPKYPIAAYFVYKNSGWISWSDFLGTKRKRKVKKL